MTEDNIFRSIFGPTADGDDLFATLFGTHTRSFGGPQFKVAKETVEDHVEYTFPLPGVSEAETLVTIKNRVLFITVVREESEPFLAYNTSLQDGLYAEGAVAFSKDGLLTVQIPFSENRDGVEVKFGTPLASRKDEESTPEA